MDTLLLTTKLYIPPVRSELVSRPRLIERLNAGLCRKLTLISAPAGFGKTTLLSEWAADFGFWISDFGLMTAVNRAGEKPESEIQNQKSKIHLAWLSLDEGDNDPARFLAYLIAALRTVPSLNEAGVGESVLAMLQSPQDPGATALPIEALLTTLVNEVAEVPDPFVLVLDDYHVITTRAIDNALGFLLDRLPPQMHLVIATRSDPALHLARLRGRGQLTELRQADLRFTPDQVAQFLNRVMGLELAADDVAALASRTEGWIAGLQMAALALRGQWLVDSGQKGPLSTDRRPPTTDRFIRAFTGSNRYIMDYLVEEVLQRQPERVQIFLLQTSILDLLTGPLCDAVVGDIGDWRLEIGNRTQSPISSLQSQAVLEYLESCNLFIVSLDKERRWYRYHRLFADLLRKRLRQVQPELVGMLHRRASEWYEQHGLMAAAIEHALSARDFERAARLVDELAETLWGHGELTTLSRWLEALPDELMSAWPQLRVYHAFLLFLAGQLDAAERRLQTVDRALGSIEAAPGGPIQLRERDRLEQQGMAAAVRAYIALFQGDVPAIIRFSRQALAVLPEEAAMWRSSVAIVLGDAHAFSGDMMAANQAYSEAVKVSRTAGNFYFHLMATGKLATNQWRQGRLRRVVEICQGALQFAKEAGLSQAPRVGGLYSLWGEILCEWNDLDQAMQHVNKGIELSEQGYNVAALGFSYLTLLRILFSQRDESGVKDTIQKLEKLTREADVPVWITNGLAAWKARICIAQGRLETATQLLQERGLSVDDELFYLRESEYLMLAYLLIAQGKVGEAMGLLERLLQRAEKGGRVGWVIAVLVLRALALHAQGDVDQAMAALERALSLAEPQGYVRTFVDAGEPMARLLYEAAARGIMPEYAGRLLTVFDVWECGRVGDALPYSHTQPLIEPLSGREIEVLQLIAEGLTNREIAQELFLALSTVKVHAYNIYSKLGVRSRTQAVAKARGLGILPSP